MNVKYQGNIYTVICDTSIIYSYIRNDIFDVKKMINFDDNYCAK